MKAAQLYASKMFPEFMAGMRKMFAPMNEGNLGHNEMWSLEPEGPYWVLTYTTTDGKQEKVFKSEAEAKTWIKGNLNEDMDLGHQDNEPHMLKGDLYRIGKYAMELYQMVDQFEGKGEVDFPHWWQAKIIKAKEMIVAAKHYLDFETKEPEIDAMMDAADDAGTFDNVGVEEPVFEKETLAEKIAKKLKNN